jgi:tetratricopeptide (TPR) repeat protein
MVRHAPVVWLVITLAALLVGCQGPPPEPKVTPADPLAPAREAMDRGDYTQAAMLLRQALASNPNNFEAHYRLGVSASYLNLKDDAIREFQWVVAQGAPDLPEVQTARDWLIRAGVLAKRLPLPAAAPSPGENRPAQTPNLASMSGKVTGEEGGSLRPMVRLQLFLKGVPTSPIKSKFHVLRTDQEGAYRFTNVVPGEYMLTNRIAGQPIWRLKVTLEPGQNLVLDLTPANSMKARDDFPQAQ